MRESTSEFLKLLELDEDSREGKELGEQLEMTPAAALETISNWIREYKYERDAEVDEIISQVP